MAETKHAVKINSTKWYTINYFISGNQHDMCRLADERRRNKLWTPCNRQRKMVDAKNRYIQLNMETAQNENTKVMNKAAKWQFCDVVKCGVKFIRGHHFILTDNR